MRIRNCMVTAATLLVAGCGDDDPSGPGGPSVDCSNEVTEVNVVVTTPGDDVVFDWSPRCRVAMLGVEADAGDRWWIGDEEQNLISPTVTYGEVPEGVNGESALPLIEGATYEVILWIATDSGAYLAAVQEFER